MNQPVSPEKVDRIQPPFKATISRKKVYCKKCNVNERRHGSAYCGKC